MRLEILERGHKLPARLFIRVSELLFGQRMDNVALTATHRPDFWGRPFFTLGTQLFRGPSYWTVGEREYMAMRVSQFNDCPFCVLVHTETTRIEARREVSVDDPSVLRPELAAVIPLLEKLTRTRSRADRLTSTLPGRQVSPTRRSSTRCTSASCSTRSIEWPTRSTGPGNPTSTCGSPRE